MLITRQVKLEKQSAFHIVYVAGKPIINKGSLFVAPKSIASNCARHVDINMKRV